MTTKVALVGASGSMGRLISQLIESEPGFEVVARLGSASPLSDMLGADVAVDVTRPGVSQSVVDFALDNGLSVLVGTSGWSADRITALEHRLATLPELGVIIVPNFSLGSVLATRFATMAARFFDSIEIVEAHHAAKIDSPSGTAVRTAELMAAARAELGPVAAPHADQRARGQQVGSIPVHSIRLQGIVARQEVIMGGDGEVLSFTHDTLSNTAYEKGIRIALRAVVDARGVTVGLDSLLDLESGSGAGA
ncbi:dihydrodipicolinate reductase [Homoserinimonas aerilata]|uniref:4-hydroxy-tetrahydrodipicolinate reductase n=1 Tax=Homoserinimonas aerilata TaxID=1162970 RepID=A0A542YJU9_9MICO|nr:dihydrodipicolinate reductase [Homoserinimonas aerilata]